MGEVGKIKSLQIDLEIQEERSFIASPQMVNLTSGRVIFFFKAKEIILKKACHLYQIPLIMLCTIT